MTHPENERTVSNHVLPPRHPYPHLVSRKRFPTPISTRTQIETTPTIFVSIVSLWEIAIKANIGKLPLSFPFNTIAPNLITARITQI